MSGPAVGAYGLRLHGLGGVERLLVAAESDWPVLEIRREQSDVVLEREELSERLGRLRLRTGGFVEIDRDAGIARFATPRLLSDAEVVHPFLAPAAAVVSHWHARSAVHAGAFAFAGRAWGIVGERESGKSSTLAWLALHGHTVVADDVLVLEDEVVFAGPRTIDLRQEASEHFAAGTNLGRVGARDRFRVDLGPIPSTLPFAGWILLSWGDAPSVRRTRARELLESLIRQRVLRVAPAAPAAWLDLAARPGWELVRPRDWSQLPATIDRLLDVLSRNG